MSATLIAPPARLAATSRALADRRPADTLYLSSATAIADHPALPGRPAIRAVV